ncbi:hypothetical protein [Georgenia satyanarayanai]|uniref:hypothetical protein n=1 Tax=Georgenia satyanarayanai TaxID=860221 RepID=UPI001265A175|nr:hypothetical protein [Georgenia satyanarayanai]
MPEPFAWVPDISRGEWLRPMESEPFGSILSVVPAGFEAYARVFHPVQRDRPRDTRTWHGVDQATHFQCVRNLEHAIEDQWTSWAATAASFGTTMHPEAQFARLVRQAPGPADDVVGLDGWRYFPPQEGCLDAAALSVAATVLTEHTTTPTAGVAAVWEGWGGLMSAGARMQLVLASSGLRRLAVTARQVGARVRDALGYRFGASLRHAKPGTGILSREVATGPRFDLHGGTGRSYVLFEAGAADFVDVRWTDRAPWIDEAIWAQSPSIIWPDDHAWVLATEIDFDSTLVAGTRVLVEELVHTPGLEVLPVPSDADLSWQGDALDHPE